MCHIETGYNFLNQWGEKSLIGLISWNICVSHIKVGLGKKYQAPKYPNSTTLPRWGFALQWSLLWKPPEVKNEPAQAWKPQEVGRSDWPLKKQNQRSPSKVILLPGEKGCPLPLGYWKKQTSKNTRKPKHMCQGHSWFDQSCFPTARQVWVSGRLRLLLWSREKGGCGHFPAVKGKANARESGRVIPAAQSSTLRMSFLPSNCTAATA